MAKTRAGTLEAIPSKRLYLSIIADYDLNRAICELVDNAIDNWVRGGRKGKVGIAIRLDQGQQRIEVLDDAGGIREADLGYIVTPGLSGSNATDQTIGIFGVGTKRAVVALAQSIRISTRYSSRSTFRVELDDEWLQDDENWNVPYYKVDDIDAGSTIVDLNQLRAPITAEAVESLSDYLGVTYARFLVGRQVSIRLNGNAIPGREFDDWSYPPEYSPRKIVGKVPAENDRSVDVEVVAGLGSESSPGAGEYGVYVYCNSRLVGRAIKTFDVGFGKGMAGAPHPKLSLTKVIVSLKGDPRSMPWNSSKSDVDIKHPVFQSIRALVVLAVSEYARISRVTMGQWEQDVFPHTEGEIEDIQVASLQALPRTLLPPPPVSRPRYGDKIAKKNSRVAKRKPWAVGLYEGLVGAHVLRQQKLSTHNRLALILIDSTIEIAMKDYLVFESGTHYSDDRLATIMKNRHLVVQEVKSTINLSEDTWKKLNWFYGLRCKLVHERATAEISDTNIEDFTSLAEALLTKLHGLKF